MRGSSWPPPGTHLLEFVNARQNNAGIAATAHLIAGLAGDEPCALELVLGGERRRWCARAVSASMARRLAAGFAAAFPQGVARPLDLAADSAADPARLAPGERALAAALDLVAPDYLPIRTFADRDIDPAAGYRADPLAGILGAAGGLPRDWRLVIQHILMPAPPRWAARYQRLALERPLAEPRRDPRAASPDPLRELLPLAGLLALGAAAWHGAQWYQAGDWLRLGALVGGGAGLPLLAVLLARLGRRPVYDPALVCEKLSSPPFRAQIRLALIAPAGVAEAALARRLREVAAAYGPYARPDGNAFRVRGLPLPAAGRAAQPLTVPWPLPGPAGILTARELAGLWHLPLAGADEPLIERTGARQRLPRPETVAAGCRIGVSRRHERAVPVHLADDLLRRQHTLAVAKTRAGKSTLLARIARYLMEDDRQAVVLVDPQRDLARQVLGLVPRERADDVVFLDAADRARPFGLNLLDAGLGWDRDRLVANLLFIFRREFAGFWGPRMEDAFRFAALTLAEANGTLVALDPRGGRERQYTALDVPALLVSEPFRRTVLDLVADPETHDWWRRHWLALREQLRQDSANPVLTKVNKFKGSRAARAVIGQPISTIDPRAWLEGRKIVIVNTGAGEIGVDSSALIGGTLVNLLKETVAAQQARDRTARDRVTLLVDEFHLLPGADFEDLLAGQAKHGANIHFATQSLARLDRAPGDGERVLRDAVFDNIRGLFAFHTSAESARALVPELGGEGDVDVEDLVGLDDYRCYARVSRGAERLPAFLVELDGPPVGDPAWAARLAAASVARYGTPGERVDHLRRAGLARIERAVQDARSRQATGVEPLPRVTGPTRRAPAGRAPAGPAKARNPQRRRKQRLPVGGGSGAAFDELGDDTAWPAPGGA